MKLLKVIFITLMFLLYGLNVYPKDFIFYGDLRPGNCEVGFKLLEVKDFSRIYPSGPSGELISRVIRIYLWYPAKSSTKNPMVFKEYVEMAVADFHPKDQVPGGEKYLSLMPVPLKKGISKELLHKLLKENTYAKKGISEKNGPFPLIVLGQGLYYESPLSHFILCEFLASYGYVVVTCPLLGTHFRLVNINARDVETQVRDLEFIMGYAKELAYVDSKKTGVIGYDLGGMAGLILAMRNPSMKAFLSMDSGVNFLHHSGLPQNHSSYEERRFTIPWMHMTQTRFVEYFGKQLKKSSLFKRKKYGHSYLATVPTTNHGCYSSYAALGLQNQVAGYWGPIEKNLKELHFQICENVLLFFDTYLKKDKESLLSLQNKSRSDKVSDSQLKIEYKEGSSPPKSFAKLINNFINTGLKNVKSEIEELLKKYPAKELVDEEVLNWLAYHFLFWWDRPQEAIEVFKLNTMVFPKSANAYDSLGEAYLTLGDKENAILSYQKSLKLNPKNKNAEEILKQLIKVKDKE